MQILANKLNEGEILSKMGAYDRNFPYNDLPLLPPEENLIYSREIFESL